MGSLTSLRKSFAWVRASWSEYDTATTRSHGYRPRNHAGRATDAQSDFRLRGGMVMMRRRISPQATRDSESVTASRCQLDWKRTPGRTTPNANSVNDIICSESMARKSICRDGSAKRAASNRAGMSHLFIFLGVVVQQLRRSKHRRAPYDLVVLF